MNTNFKQVYNWHKMAGIPVADIPVIVPEKRQSLRVELVKEEARELTLAIFSDSIVDIADAVADLLVVTYGTAVEYGINADKCFKEVMRSNYTKIQGAEWRPDGKLMKGPYFEPPNLVPLLFPKVDR